MTAFDRAQAGHPWPAKSAAAGRLSDRSVVRGGAWGIVRRVRLFSQDVWTGVRLVGRNTLASVGFVAIVVGAFLVGQPDWRRDIETQALSWLTERVNSRLALVTEEAPSDDGMLLAMAEPEAIQRATAIDPTELNRQQAAVAYWISKRYNVAPEPISRLVQEAWTVGRQANLEPTLVLAVMAVESGFNPFAQSHVGAQGLMQVMTRVHHDKYQIFGGQHAAFDPVTNLRVGVQVLKECIRRAGGLENGLKFYVGAANLTDDGGYAAKVMAEQAFMRQVAAGRKVAVTAPLPQAVAIPQSSANAEAPAPSASDRSAPGMQAIPASPAGSDSAPTTRRSEQLALAP